MHSSISLSLNICQPARKKINYHIKSGTKIVRSLINNSCKGEGESRERLRNLRLFKFWFNWVLFGERISHFDNNYENLIIVGFFSLALISFCAPFKRFRLAFSLWKDSLLVTLSLDVFQKCPNKRVAMFFASFRVLWILLLSVSRKCNYKFSIYEILSSLQFSFWQAIMRWRYLFFCGREGDEKYFVFVPFNFF